MSDIIESQYTVDEVIRGLMGWEFSRTRHGSLYDRGSADSYYGRSPRPHYGGVGSNSGERVEVTDEASILEYMAGYEWNETYGDRKGWD